VKRIAIIGGGISGLSAAYSLEKIRKGIAGMDFSLFEAAPRVGGVLVSEHVDGCLVEAGPDSFLTEKPWAAQLCREVGLGDQIIGSNDAQRKTYIVVKNRMIEMPDGLMFMVPTKIMPTVLTPLFSWGAKIKMAQEMFHPPKVHDGDESVADLVRRHFGQEMVDRLADPLLSGVYGGDSANLSARAVLPRFVELEKQYGSLSRGMLAARKKMVHAMKGRPTPPLFSSLKNGMQQLVDALVAQLRPASLRTGTAVEDVSYSSDKWRVQANGRAENFDGVIFAAPAHVVAALLSTAAPELARELGGISYSSSITTTLIYDRATLDGKDKGFGFLVPRTEGRRMLACTFVHNKFPHRAPENRGIVRAFLGGLRDESVLGLSDDEVIATITRELREIAGIQGEPRDYRIYRWNRAMAQPAPGHLERLARIEQLRKQFNGLALAGNAYTGIGVPDCVRTGSEAANEVARAILNVPVVAR
jgi:protoporphyrinogen/coproporphyrinogen III oxidase